MTKRPKKFLGSTPKGLVPPRNGARKLQTCFREAVLLAPIFSSRSYGCLSVEVRVVKKSFLEVENSCFLEVEHIFVNHRFSRERKKYSTFIKSLGIYQGQKDDENFHHVVFQLDEIFITLDSNMMKISPS